MISKEFVKAVKKSTVLRAAFIVSALTMTNFGLMEAYTRFQDWQTPVTSRKGDRWQVEGPGYSIEQSQIDPQIVRLSRDSIWLDRNPFERGRNHLLQLCGPGQTLFQDWDRHLYVRLVNASECLAPRQE
jgi:hypothetical protein